MHREQAVFSCFKCQTGRRIAFADEVEKIGKGFFSGLFPLRVTEPFEVQHGLGLVTLAEFVADVAFLMNQTFLLKRGRPMASPRRLDGGAAIANDEQPSLIAFFNPALPESLNQDGHDRFAFAAALLEIQRVLGAFTINSNRQDEAEFPDPDTVDLNAEEVEFIDRSGAQEIELLPWCAGSFHGLKSLRQGRRRPRRIDCADWRPPGRSSA